MKKKAFTVFFILFLIKNTFAQDQSQNTVAIDSSSQVYCNPKLEGMGPSRGVVVSYQRVFNTSVNSTSRNPEIGARTSNILRNNLLEVKIRVPFYNKPSLKLLGGFTYEYQEFIFESEEAEPTYDLYKNLQQRHLKTIGLNLSGLKSFDETHYLVFQFRGDLNGDYSAEELPTIDFLKGSVSALYGIKKCATKTYAFGLNYSYTFGRQGLIPAFLYNNTFNKRWGVELLLPAEAKVRYNFNRNTLIYAGAEVDGASYNLIFSNPPLSNITNAQLRRSAVKALVEFNKEIHDWLWFGVSGGVLQPISFNVTERGDKGTRISFKDGIKIERGNPLIRNKLVAAPFINFSLFVVPPRKLENKILNPRNE